ncbi:DNA helicase [Tanacetum coccineum]
MDYIRTHQNDIRSDHLSGLYNAISRGDLFGIAVGSKIILPTSFTGGPRYMYSHYLDALAIFRSLRNPQFFITFICNVNWHEIKRYMAQYPELTPADRPDIPCDGSVVYPSSFRNGSCHIVTHSSGSIRRDKMENAEQLDQYISAELPDPEEDPTGNKIVSDMMMHRPCSGTNLDALCMQKVKDFGLLDPPPHLLEDLKNKLLMEEKNYKRELLMREKIHLVPNTLRSEGKIVLAVASSGIASLFLPVALDRSLRDLMDAPDALFKGKTVKNKKRSQEFADWLLDVGNGELGELDEEDAEDTCWINTPAQFCVITDEKGIAELIDFIYDEETLKMPTSTSL